MSMKVTSGTGFQQHLVKIVELLPDDATPQARCQNPKTSEEYYASLTQRHYAVWPQVGDYWIITRSVGPWDLTIKITPPAPPEVDGVVYPGSALDGTIVALAGLGLIDNQTTHQAWGIPAYDPDWADATTFGSFSGGHGLRYTSKDGELWLYGLVAASTGAGTTICTLPAGYFNTTSAGFGVYEKINGSTLSSALVSVTTAGAVVVEVTPANGDTFLINMKVPLGTLP